MTSNDFRYMRRGEQLSSLTKDDLELLKPINQRGSGKERALLMFHGFASSPAVFRYLLPNIKHYDALICPQLFGHGQSLEQFSHSTAQQWLDSAQTACEELLKEYKKVDVLGLSLGGLISCRLAEKYPINHLYLLAPALKLRMHTSRILRLAKVIKFLGFNHLRNRAGNILHPIHSEIAFRTTPISTIIEILQFIQNYQWKPPTCPIDLFLGRHDLVVDCAAIEGMFRHSPKASIHWLENSAHVLPLEDEMIRIVDYLNDQHTGTDM